MDITLQVRSYRHEGLLKSFPPVFHRRIRLRRTRIEATFTGGLWPHIVKLICNEHSNIWIMEMNLSIFEVETQVMALFQLVIGSVRMDVEIILVITSLSGWVHVIINVSRLSSELLIDGPYMELISTII